MEKFYKYYFEQLAKKKLLSHTDKEPAFFLVKDKWEPTSFNNAIGSCAKFPAMLLEKYSYDLDDNNNRNVFKHLNCRFNILDKSDKGEQDSIDQVQQRCEAIAEKFLFKMLSDMRDGTVIQMPGTTGSPKTYFGMSNVQIDPIGPMAVDYYGVTVSFKWKFPIATTVITSDWDDQ